MPDEDVLVYFAGNAGNTYAKNVILIAIANPACSTATAITRILLIFASVTLTTGHKFRTKNTTLTTNPIAVKT